MTEDGRDDVFLSDGKTDTGGVQENTPEARGVLTLANTATQSTLLNEVGLSQVAARNIIDMRGNGFTTLAQLDNVPFVAPG